MLNNVTDISSGRLGWRDLWRLPGRNRKVTLGLALLVFFILLATIGPLLIHHDPNAFSTTRLQPPSTEHWLGTTQTGQDVLAQVIYGARTSIFMGFAIGILTMIIAIVVGLAAGYYGGWIDDR